MHGGKQRRFHDLRFRNRRGHAQHRLARKENRALRHGPDFAAKTKLAQIVEEARVHVLEGREPPQIGDVLLGESHALEKIQRLLETRGNEVVPRGRQFTDEQLEGRHRGHVFPQIARGHRQFVEVGQQTRSRANGGHPAFRLGHALEKRKRAQPFLLVPPQPPRASHKGNVRYGFPATAASLAASFPAPLNSSESRLSLPEPRAAIYRNTKQYATASSP